MWKFKTLPYPTVFYRTSPILVRSSKLNPTQTTTIRDEAIAGSFSSNGQPQRIGGLCELAVHISDNLT